LLQRHQKKLDKLDNRRIIDVSWKTRHGATRSEPFDPSKTSIILPSSGAHSLWSFVMSDIEIWETSKIVKAIRSSRKRDNEARKVLIEAYWHYGKRLELLPTAEKAPFRLECCLSPERTRAANAVAALSAKELAHILSMEEPLSINELMNRKGHQHKKTARGAEGHKVPNHNSVKITITVGQAAFLRMVLLDRDEREAIDILAVLPSEEDEIDDSLEDWGTPIEVAAEPVIAGEPAPIEVAAPVELEVAEPVNEVAAEPVIAGEPALIEVAEPIILKKAGKHNGAVIRPGADVWAAENAKIAA
jgi:hypothetical protein